jgi:phosphoglycolate phosphatase-like HAD superfamily hydrolase
MSCQIADGLEELRACTPQARWLIVSGGDQSELRQIFEQRGLARLFDGGIFGSPDAKSRILEREMNRGNITPPALFLGDSRLDHQVAEAKGLDFVFVSEWTDLEDWETYTRHHSLETIEAIGALLDHPQERKHSVAIKAARVVKTH